MILHRIAGGIGSGKTWSALHAMWNSTRGENSLYIAQNMQDARRCARIFCHAWGSGLFQNLEVMWPHGSGRFSSVNEIRIGISFRNIILDCNLANLDPMYIAEIVRKVDTKLVIVSGDPWQRETFAWLKFRQLYGRFFSTHHLTICRVMPSWQLAITGSELVGARQRITTITDSPRIREIATNQGNVMRDATLKLRPIYSMQDRAY